MEVLMAVIVMSTDWLSVLLCLWWFSQISWSSLMSPMSSWWEWWHSPTCYSTSSVSSLELHQLKVRSCRSQSVIVAFSALTLLVGRQEEHPACKNLSD